MIRWTGNGALSLVVLMLGISAGAAGIERRDTVLSVTWFVLCMVATSLINQALAFWLNGEPTPAGRRWRRDGGPHTLWLIPMQSWTPVPLVVGMGVLAVTVWATVAPWAGIATFLGTATAWVGVKALWRRRPGRPGAGAMPRPGASGPVPRTTVEPPAPPPAGAPPYRPAGRPDGEPFGPDRPRGPRDWTQTDPSVTWMRPDGLAAGAKPHANLCAQLDRAAMARAFGRPLGDHVPGTEGAAGGSSLLCVITFVSEPDAGHVRTAVTRVSATFAGDPAAAARFYDQTWATAGQDPGGEESRDPDGLGESAFGFAASEGGGGSAASYLVSVLDSNLVLTVEQRVFAPDPIRRTARARGLARAFDLARQTIPRLA